MKTLFVAILLAFSMGLLILPAQAQLKTQGGESAFTKFGKDTFGKTYETSQGKNLEQSLPAAVGQIISVVLGLLGVILLVIMVYAGFLWLTAGGNDEQVKKAKKWIINAVIGITIALGAFIITSFVVTQLQTAVSNAPTQNAGGT